MNVIVNTGPSSESCGDVPHAHPTAPGPCQRVQSASFRVPRRRGAACVGEGRWGGAPLRRLRRRFSPWQRTLRLLPALSEAAWARRKQPGVWGGRTLSALGPSPCCPGARLRSSRCECR